MKTNTLLPLALLILISCGTAPMEENNPSSKHWLKLTDSVKTTEKEAIGTVIASPEGIFEQFIPIPMYVEKWLVAPGAYVEKGQSIVSLQHPDFVALQGQFFNSRNKVTLLEKKVDRWQQAVSSGAGSELEKDVILTELSQAMAEFKKSKAMLSALGISVVDLNTYVDHLILKSQINGFISVTLPPMGSLTHDNQALFTILNPTKTEIRFEWLPGNLPLPQKGDTMEIQIENDVYPLMINRTSLDNRGTTPLLLGFCTIPPNVPLVPGQRIIARKKGSSTLGLRIPEHKIIHQADSLFVWICPDTIPPANTLQQVPVSRFPNGYGIPTTYYGWFLPSNLDENP
jgi:cobalt-zinc-cadmium efflux system membrane fusion protein